MRWVAISGSWRKTNENVRRDVEETVKNELRNGNGIVTGGALGVDYFATNAVIEEGAFERLRIYLPIPLEDFCVHYRKRAEEGVITNEQAESVISQLELVDKMNAESIIDGLYAEADTESYYARNKSIAENCDILYAFQVNESRGTQNAIDKATALGKEIRMKKYEIR